MFAIHSWQLLAIVIVAGLLSQNRTQEYLKNIADSIKTNVCTDPEQCLDILALSYNYLPHHLKDCFLYMEAFPEDCEIEARKMIQIWIAKDLIVHGSSKNLAGIAKVFLENLIDKSLVMVGKSSSRGTVKTCGLQDLLLELCPREAQKENFMSVLKE
ncbi:hypothetical protein ACH5RR_036242 [Cinchona calisaya]|uniref:Disease resistance protein winged helix domain-containing protein n=1 Tax=Cinchona calisaya TaxID=153742 RepID=A0ABD2Y2S7_9GENT